MVCAACAGSVCSHVVVACMVLYRWLGNASHEQSSVYLHKGKPIVLSVVVLGVVKLSVGVSRQ